MPNFVKIYDCSNSNDRPAHRNGGGPKDNNIITYLKKFSWKYDCVFIDDFSKADVAITNDVFPDFVINSSIRKVKRMDGVFFLESLKQRNEPYNRAAQLADHVIFISEFSKNSYFELYGNNIKSHSVAVNRAGYEFYPDKNKNINEKFSPIAIAVASDWSRKEKRFDDMMRFAEYLKNNGKPQQKTGIFLVGTCKVNVPDNVVKCGYISSHNEVANIMRKCDYMINFSYKDPCPKTVAQGVSCGLPIFYADSGGTKEMIYAGIAVPDKKRIKLKHIRFEEDIPPLNFEDILNGWGVFINKINMLSKRAKSFDGRIPFNNMLNEYFKYIMPQKEKI